MPAARVYTSELRRAAKLKWEHAPPGLNAVDAATFLAKLQAGKSIRDMVGSATGGDHICSHNRFADHAKQNPEWGAECRRLSYETACRRKSENSVPRNRTHCIHGHPLTGDNLYVSPGRTERKCRTCLNLRYSKPTPPTPEQIQQATAALNAGKSITEVCIGVVNGKKVSKPIFSFRKLKFLRAQNPAFHNFVLAASVGSGSRAQMRRYRPDEARKENTRAETNDFYQIVGMVPRHLPPDARDDIAQSIMIALLEGSIQRDQVRGRIGQFVQDRNRMFPPKFAKFGDARLVSLDEVLFEDGSTTRGDTVSRGLWD